jgi:hypothetical protein
VIKGKVPGDSRGRSRSRKYSLGSPGRGSEYSSSVDKNKRISSDRTSLSFSPLPQILFAIFTFTSKLQLEPEINRAPPPHSLTSSGERKQKVPLGISGENSP